jgi:hypothetical protein
MRGARPVRPEEVVRIMKSPFNKKAFLQVVPATVPTIRGRALRRRASNHARCNLCDRVFRASSGFHRFCRACRSDDELFKFAEWLPQS